eukprot:TRINITY_DN1979_c3_g1_i1.p1 TRINITY_DN1979_c3_g1~~TRINITY_DN1979_c3_g1_i1.p1  ORF type:complete len:729 (-),score=327.52 TRINITY_DN1979_c3_g1_i1:105-2291(-)
MWKLNCENGRQVWEFIENGDAQVFEQLRAQFNPLINPNSGDRFYRYLKLQDFKPFDFKESEENLKSLAELAQRRAIVGANFYGYLQDEDGHWPADYGGPMFLLPGLVFTCYITGFDLGVPTKQEMIRYIFNHQNLDGGWGTHIESNSTIFGTSLNYVALRLLGANADNDRVIKGRSYLLSNGGAIGIPSWGKFWLSTLGLYDWSGQHTLLPEMWLFPQSLPIHPWRFWCHCRMVYLPMAYVFGERVTATNNQLLNDIRNEIYTQPYNTINWKNARDAIASTDLYNPHSFILKFANKFLNIYENWHLKSYRKKALEFVLEYINAEDTQTKYVDIGPVNKVINMLAVWHAYGPDSNQYKQHANRIRDYLWLAEDGMKMQGYNGSQLWDCTFACQAYFDAKLDEISGLPTESLIKAYKYLESTQVLEDVENRDRFFRHISKGGWPFSTRDHGWPISDCTAEGLTATLFYHKNAALMKHIQQAKINIISDERLFDAVNVILSFQNQDGGWATYENTRGSSYLELLNPAHVFSDIMIDHSYTECTAASIRSLRLFNSCYPEHRRTEIEVSIHRGADLIKRKQKPDGSWYGSWAVCFTYGTWFGVEGLLAAGESPSCLEIRRACAFLHLRQNADGGWGENSQSCAQKRYVRHAESQVVNTAWALLTLMAAEDPNKDKIERGIRFLISKQTKEGDWNQQSISGVFNANCMITYTAYRNVFPIWALGRYFNHYCKK